jgi:hypothetical protein
MIVIVAVVEVTIGAAARPRGGHQDGCHDQHQTNARLCRRRDATQHLHAAPSSRRCASGRAI